MQTKQICKTPYAKDSLILINLFSAISTKMNCPLTIQQIKSASIFPEIATAHDEHILYWDMQYWDFFDRFLLELSFFLENSDYEEMFSNRILALYYDYLSLKLLHFPELAYCIQVNKEIKFKVLENDKTKNNYGTYKILGSLYESGIFYSRILVFFHEFFHLYYKLNPNVKTEDCERLNKLAEFYCDGDWLDDIKNDDTTDILMDGFQKLLNSKSDKLMEESSCDYRALIETISMQKKIYNNPNRFSIQEIQKIHDIFHINQTFLSYLTNIFTCWEILYKVYIRVDTYEDLMKNSQPYFDKAAHMAIIRNSIIPDFLDKLNIKKYGMSSYISILNRPNIKTAIQNVADKMVDLNFMLYAIEEAIKLSQLPHFNPFELKKIVLCNAGYQV